MKKPVIGLTPSHNIETGEIHMGPRCLRAIEMAGGIPLVLPVEIEEDDLRQLAEQLDGILFTGGADPHPFFFGEETLTGCGEISVKRDTMELALLSLAMEYRKPIMGICRGIQMINIGLGGDIYQDIPSQVNRELPIAHRQPPMCYGPSHTVTVTPGSMLADICETAAAADIAASSANGAVCGIHMPSPVRSSGESPRICLQVNSSHHQAVRRIAPGLSVCAKAPDGIIEGIEMKDYPFLLGVQWHPEYLWEKDPAAAALFQAFVTACGSE